MGLDLQRALVQARELVYADPEGDTPEALLRWMADRWALLMRLAHEAEAVDPGAFGVLLGYVEGHLAGWPEVLWSRCSEDFADVDEAARWVERLRGPVMDDVSLWLTSTPTPPPSWRLLRFVDACPSQGRTRRPIQPSDLLGRFPLLPLTGAAMVTPESPKTFRKLLGTLRGARHLSLKLGSGEGEDDPLAVFAKNAPEGLDSLRLEGGEWTAQRARLLSGAGWWPRLRALDLNMRSEAEGRAALMGEVLGRASALQSLALPMDWGHEEVFGLCDELALPTLRRLVVRPRETFDAPTGLGWRSRGPWEGEEAVWRADWRGALRCEGLRRLALADVGMCGEDWADAMDGPWFGRLRALDLSLNPLGDLALEALATAPGGVALRELRLDATLDATSLSDIPNPYWFERRADLGEFDAIRYEDAQGEQGRRGDQDDALEIEWDYARRRRVGQTRPDGPRTRARAKAIGALWSGPALSGLVSLGLRDNFLTGGLDALAEPGPSLALASLDLGRCRLWPQDLEALGRTRRLPALRRLRLDHNPRAWSEASARALGERLVGLRALDLRGCELPPAILEGLGRSPLGESLEELVLDEERSADGWSALWRGWRGLRCLRLQPSAPEPRAWAVRAGRLSHDEEREYAYHHRYGFGRWYAPDEERPLGLSALLPLVQPDVMPCLELLVVTPDRPWDDLGASLEPRLVGALRERGVVFLRGQPTPHTWAL